jgi:hypothetical protein
MTQQAAVWLDEGLAADAAIELEFWLNYLGQPLSLELYEHLSQLAPTRRMLDVTPDYVGLTVNTLQSYASQLPGTKFIIMLRSPEERLRSQVRFDIASGARLGDSHHSGYIEDYLQSPYSLSQINVHRHIKNMIQCFPAEDIFISFYDDLRDRPRELCDKIAEFCETFIQGPVPGIVNAHADATIPAWLLSYVRTVTEPVANELAQLVGGHASAWRDSQTTFNCLMSGTIAELQARQRGEFASRSDLADPSVVDISLSRDRRVS